MFDKTCNNTIVSSHVNAVSGNITKTYSKSFFKRVHLQSSTAEGLLSHKPTIILDYKAGEKIPVQVIQMIIFGDVAIVEIITQGDYDEIINSQLKRRY